MGQENKGLGASSLREDRATRASTEPASGLGPDGRVSHSAGLGPNAGSIAAARYELTKLSAALYPEPFGASRVSICAADLYALVVAAERYAAAPDLLEACEGAFRFLALHRESGKGPTHCEAQLRAAIAKARGEQP